MYERTNPLREYVAGGYVDMTDCRYEQVDQKTTRASGARFVTDPVVKVKIEGAGMVGQRRLAIVGIRDPYTIGLIDKAIAWGRGKLEERFGPAGERLPVLLPRLRTRRGHGCARTVAAPAAARALHRGRGAARRQARRGNLRARRAQSVLRTPAGGEGNGGRGGDDPTRSSSASPATSGR